MPQPELHMMSPKDLGQRHRRGVEEYLRARAQQHPQYPQWRIHCNGIGRPWGTQVVIRTDITPQVVALVTYAKFPGIDQDPAPRSVHAAPSITFDVLVLDLVTPGRLIRAGRNQASGFGLSGEWAVDVPKRDDWSQYGQQNLQSHSGATALFSSRQRFFIRIPG